MKKLTLPLALSCAVLAGALSRPASAGGTHTPGDETPCPPLADCPVNTGGTGSSDVITELVDSALVIYSLL